MGDVRRVTLDDPLAGEWIDVDLDNIEIGMLEDLEAGQSVRLMLDALVAAIAATSLVTADLTVPEGMSPVRALLRRMKPPQLQAVVAGIGKVGSVPKAS